MAIEGRRYGTFSSSSQHSVDGSAPKPAIASGNRAFRNEGPSFWNPPQARDGYQPLGAPYGEDDQASTSCGGVFNISTYKPYFNVDTDTVLYRLVTSVNPMNGGFLGKIDSNPDLYAPIWVSTTLVFMLAAIGDFATYLMRKRAFPYATWDFDVNYVSSAACLVYGYALIAPAAFYCFRRYSGFNASLVQFWCLWGYSLFIFVPSIFLLVIPVEIVRWIVILIAGLISSCFLGINLNAHTNGSDLAAIGGASLLQFSLALSFKGLFFA